MLKGNRMVAMAMVAGICVFSGCSAIPPPAQPASDTELVAYAASKAAARSPQLSVGNPNSARENPNLVFPDRLNKGYTLVLPGVGGDSAIDHGVIQGLQDANVQSAIELHNWTSGSWRPVYDLRSLERNRAESQTIAAKIVLYQEQHPGRPVYLIGYSGGGGVAVLVLEALPDDHQVARAILLGPTVACDYDLQSALTHTEHDLYNFYSPLDVPVLGALTVALGTTEGRHTLAAGAVGFQIPESLDAAARNAYQSRLVQQSYRLEMLADGHAGGHFGWRSRAFVAKYVGPLIQTSGTAETQTIAQKPPQRGDLSSL
jgi:pimeloyl-ACP methyl ester carboxylesterase